MKFRSILGIFGESPFMPLYQHAAKVREAAGELDDLILAFCERDAKRIEELAEKVSNLEFEADQIKQATRLKASRSVMLPVARTDFLEFLKPQDSIADKAEDLAKLLTLREPPELPQDVKDGLIELSRKTIAALDAYERATKKISKLVKTSFRKREIKETLEIIPEVERIEHELDIIGIKLSKRIFQLEKEIGPVAVFHLAKVVEILLSVSDLAAMASDRLRTMISR